LRHSCWQTRQYCLAPVEVGKRSSFPEQSLQMVLVSHRSPPPAAASRLMPSFRPWHPSSTPAQLYTMRGAFAHTSDPLQVALVDTDPTVTPFCTCALSPLFPPSPLTRQQSSAACPAFQHGNSDEQEAQGQSIRISKFCYVHNYSPL
jgi:hypothetical protein